MKKITNLFLIAILLIVMSCLRTDPAHTMHQIINNSTNHTIKIITYKYKRIDSVIILPKTIFTKNVGSAINPSLPTFDDADSIYVYIDSSFCNVYRKCYLFVNDTAAYHKCISDSFNLLQPIYKIGMISNTESVYSYTIDEKFCTHCK